LVLERAARGTAFGLHQIALQDHGADELLKIKAPLLLDPSLLAQIPSSIIDSPGRVLFWRIAEYASRRPDDMAGAQAPHEGMTMRTVSSRFSSDCCVCDHAANFARVAGRVLFDLETRKSMGIAARASLLAISAAFPQIDT
jgi:hypothetical protein